MNASNQKIIKRIALLNNTEQKAFTKWLASPWCNSNKKLLPLFKYIQRYYEDFRSGNLSKERLFKSIYPSTIYNDKWMRNIQSELGQQVERFLIYQRLEKNQTLQNLLLTQEFQERHKEDWFEKLSRHSIDTLEKEELKTDEHYLHLNLFYEQLYFQPNAAGRIHEGEHILKQTEKNLDHFYAVNKYRILNEFVERNKVLQTQLDKENYHNTLKEMFGTVKSPAIELYQQRLALNNEPRIDQFLTIKERYKKYLAQLLPKDQKILLLSLINDAARLRIQGHSEMLNEIFELYRLGLDKEILLHNGQLTSRSYTNIVTVGNLLKKTDYINSFILDYSHLLPQQIQHDAATWAKAHTIYNLGQFESCVELLVAHQFSHHLFSIQSRALLLQAYFDLYTVDDSYYEYLNHYCIAFEKFIRRDRVISKIRKKSYLHLIKYTKNLAKAIDKKEITTQYLQDFQDQLSIENNLQGKSWLLRKLNQLST